MLLEIIKKLEKEEDGAKIVRILEEAEKASMDGATAKKYIDELERTGDIFSPKPGILRIVRRDEG
jgi:DNA replicative helicase MCM subunit Mcm2 (Cdc46/Mcm family)